jgi:diacylglycerol O-acyltransferase
MRTPVANVDAAWLRMDDPTNLMVVTGLMVLGHPVSFDGACRMLERSLLRFSRFRQRIVEPPGGVGTPYWETDEHFALDNHLTEVDLPPPGDERALQALVSSLMSQPLNPAQPLWHYYLVPHYDGGSALIARIHHCIGDGLALIYVMLSMADDGPQPPEPAEENGDSNHASPWDALGHTISSAANTAVSLPWALVRQLNELVGDPDRLAQATDQMTAGAGALGKLLLMGSDPKTVVQGPLVAEKRVAWSHPIAVSELKLIGKATGSTINDILMSSLAGALRRYLLSRGERPPGDLNVRGVVPVNLRPIEKAHELGNQFGLVFLALPLGIDDSLDRLFEVRRRMHAIKNSPEAYVAFQILKGLGVAPKQIFDLIVNEFGRKATAVVTNVIGPRQPIAIAGARMRQAMFWVPCSGRLGLGVSLLSYAGDVWLGVQTDVSLVPDPQTLLDGFHEEIAELTRLRRQAGA